VSFAMPSLRVYRATDDLAREIAGRIKRFGLVMLGFAIILAGVAIAPLPGPGGIPVIVVGLMVVLKNSFKARRQFVRLHKAHPKVLSPIRRLLRRDPEFMALFYHQTLRVERILLPKRIRFVKPLRRKFRRPTAVAA
jgi:Putative transmembrane protein (PGPGW)